MQPHKSMDLMMIFKTHKGFLQQTCRSTFMKKPLVAKGLRIREMKCAMGEVNKRTSVLWAMELTYAMQVIIKLIKI